MSEDMPSDSQQHRQQNKYYDLRCKRTRSSLDLPASSENFETLVTKGNAVVQSKVKRGSKGMDQEQFLLAFMESVTSRVHTFEQTGQGGFGVGLVDTFKRIFSEEELRLFVSKVSNDRVNALVNGTSITSSAVNHRRNRTQQAHRRLLDPRNPGDKTELESNYELLCSAYPHFNSYSRSLFIHLLSRHQDSPHHDCMHDNAPSQSDESELPLTSVQAIRDQPHTDRAHVAPSPDDNSKAQDEGLQAQRASSPSTSDGQGGVKRDEPCGELDRRRAKRARNARSHRCGSRSPPRAAERWDRRLGPAASAADADAAAEATTDDADDGRDGNEGGAAAWAAAEAGPPQGQDWVSEVEEIIWWLGGFGMGMYARLLISEGWDSLEVLTTLKERDLLRLGVRSGHARKIMLRLPAFAEAHGYF